MTNQDLNSLEVALVAEEQRFQKALEAKGIHSYFVDRLSHKHAFITYNKLTEEEDLEAFIEENEADLDLCSLGKIISIYIVADRQQCFLDYLDREVKRLEHKAKRSHTYKRPVIIFGYEVEVEINHTAEAHEKLRSLREYLRKNFSAVRTPIMEALAEYDQAERTDGFFADKPDGTSNAEYVLQIQQGVLENE